MIKRKQVHSYRKYKVGEEIKISERDYNAGNEPNNRGERTINTYKVIQDYPLFVVCERKAKCGNAIIRTSVLKSDLEMSKVTIEREA